MPIQRKILTVVLLSAGCGASSSRTPAPAPAPSRVPVPEVAATSTTAADEPVVTVSLLPEPAPLAVAFAAPPEIVRDEMQPESVMRLRSELYGASDADLNAHHAKFRALCDANGYPVVGNVASKSMRHDVGSYCQDVRTQLVMR